MSDVKIADDIRVMMLNEYKKVFGEHFDGTMFQTVQTRYNFVSFDMVDPYLIVTVRNIKTKEYTEQHRFHIDRDTSNPNSLYYQIHDYYMIFLGVLQRVILSEQE